MFSININRHNANNFFQVKCILQLSPIDIILHLFRIQDASQIPIMNIVWFFPALLGLLMIVTTVKHSSPPTPPSRSAELNSHYDPDCSYLKAIWMLLRNGPCMILTLTIGKVVPHLDLCYSTLRTTDLNASFILMIRKLYLTIILKKPKFST